MGRTASLHGGHIGLMTLTVGGQVEAISWNTAQGFSTALSAFVAQNHAAGKRRRIRSAYRHTLAVSIAIGLTCAALFILFGSRIYSFIVPEEAAWHSGGIFLRIDGYSMPFMMLEITMQGLFYGLGRSLPPAIISIIFNLVRIPLAIFAASAIGITGVWWALSLTSIGKGAAIFIYYHITELRKK
jgi:Na+-driven multidrug efflux pump